MKQLLLVSSGFTHPSVKARYILKRMLKRGTSAHIATTGQLSAFATITVGNPDVVVLYYHQQKIDPRLIQSLSEYVHSGGRIAAIHSATASFKTYPAYFEIVGGRFSGHGPVEEFEVQAEVQSTPDASTAKVTPAGDHTPAGTKPADCPDFSPVPERFSVTDELYRHQFFGEVAVHFRSASGSAVGEPVVWSRQYGQGRVFYASFGHTASALNVTACRDIILSGVNWLLR